MLTIYGASDDLIEIEGDIREEFSALGSGRSEANLIACSDGTLLRITYTKAGIWRIEPVATGTATLTIETCVEENDDGYTDRATLDGEITWVAIARSCATKRANR